jgi:peptidoglycan/LPS O-acetylase OafA/YrhL
VLFRTFVALLFATLLIWSIGLTTQGWLSSILRQLGEISYGIYLWHHMIITLLAGAGLTRWELVATSLVATLSTAWISHRFVEMPTQRTIKAFSNSRFASSS